MIVTPLSDRATAVRDALLSHGWEGDLARLAAGGLAVAAFEARDLPPGTTEAMLPVAARLGLELVTGDDWLILAGPRSRFGAFARPWMQPEPLRELATAIGLALPEDNHSSWRHARGVIDVEQAVMIGVLNVTPDSFAESVAAITPDDALRRTDALLAGGASIIDVGGESTRPGAEPVSLEVEQSRILPVVEAIARVHATVPISVDTVHASTAARALDAGATIINDVTAGRHDPALLTVTATRQAGIVLSHSRGPLGQLASYAAAAYQGDVVSAVAREIRDAMTLATAAGISAESIVVDPGFGFGKTPEQSFALLDRLDAIVALGRPVLVGVSRKRFLGVASGRAVDDRDRATAAACALAFARGARLFRVHSPEAVRDALAVAEATVERSPA
ncbi:MAG: dihydropteroate synthase [Gemmatimonadales bacterium]